MTGLTLISFHENIPTHSSSLTHMLCYRKLQKRLKSCLFTIGHLKFIKSIVILYPDIVEILKCYLIWLLWMKIWEVSLSSRIWLGNYQMSTNTLVQNCANRNQMTKQHIVYVALLEFKSDWYSVTSFRHWFALKVCELGPRRVNQQAWFAIRLQLCV